METLKRFGFSPKRYTFRAMVRSGKRKGRSNKGAAITKDWLTKCIQSETFTRRHSKHALYAKALCRGCWAKTWTKCGQFRAITDICGFFGLISAILPDPSLHMRRICALELLPAAQSARDRVQNRAHRRDIQHLPIAKPQEGHQEEQLPLHFPLKPESRHQVYHIDKG